MAIYFIAALLPVFFDIIYENSGRLGRMDGSARRRRMLLFLIISSVPMFIILGFRGYRIGTDTTQYVSHFRRIRLLSFSEAREYSEKNEPVLYLLMYFCGQISSDPTFFLCVVGLIMTACFLIFVYKNREGELLTIFFHVALGTFLFIVTGMRQGLAISFCLLAIDFARRRKLIPFVIIMVLAFFTHRSSIMFSVVYIMANRKLSFLNVVLLSVATVIFIVFLDNFQNWFNSAIEYDYDIEETGNGGIFLAVVVLMNLVALLLHREVLAEFPGALVLYNTSLIALVLWIARLFTRTAERPSYYFLPATFAVTAISIHKIKNPYLRLAVIAAVIVLSLLLLFHRLSSAPSLNPFYFA